MFTESTPGGAAHVNVVTLSTIWEADNDAVAQPVESQTPLMSPPPLAVDSEPHEKVEPTR